MPQKSKSRRARSAGWGREKRARFQRTTNPPRIYLRTEIRPRREHRTYEAYQQGKRALAELREGLPAARTESGWLRLRSRAPLPALILFAPKILSFSKNHNEMLGFIRDYQWYVHVPLAASPHDNMVVDLATVEYIDLDAALVLVAEYHRACMKRRGYHPPIDDANWPQWVRALLESLGFYQLVQAAERTADPEILGSFPFTFVPFIAGSSVEGEAVNEIISRLSAAAGRTPRRIATYNALLEALKNVKIHAYPDDAPPQVAPIVPNWWTAGAFDPAERQLQFVVYDQGVGIPATLPRRSIWESIRMLCPLEFNDADLLQGALEWERSASGLRERGNGLWAICSLVEELPGSQVRILSGSGELTYFSDGSLAKKLHDKPFCGTLIEWSLILPSEGHAGVAL